MLSVSIVAKNEERTIGRCIESVKSIADEIIVVDSGSEDRTVDIAKSLGAKVVFREWTDYVDQVNYAIGLCTGDWILILDADEIVSEELASSIKSAVEDPKYTCYKLKRKLYYLGKFLSFTEERIRLFKKGKGIYEGFVHERVKCMGSTGVLDGYLYHYSYGSISEHIRKTMNYAERLAEESCRKGLKFNFVSLIFNPAWTFLKYFFLKGCYKDGVRGFIFSGIMCFYTFMKYAFLLEKYILHRLGESTWRK